MSSEAKSEKPKKPRGQVHILEEWCKGCGFCVEFCPKDVLEFSKSFNEKGYHPPCVKSPENCNACTFCELYCPEFSIWATKINKD